VEDTKPDALVFSTKGGTPVLPNSVVRRFIFPACKRLGLPRATWSTVQIAAAIAGENDGLDFVERASRRFGREA
jgi:hypothetical protein